MAISDIMLNKVYTLDPQQVFGSLAMGTVQPGIYLDFNTHGPAHQIMVFNSVIKITRDRARCKGQEGKSGDLDFQEGLVRNSAVASGCL